MDAETPNVDLPTTDKEVVPEKIEDEEIKVPLIHCELCDEELVHKLAQVFLPGLSTACVDNTSGDIFRTPGSVAAEIRKEMVDYITMRSETCVAESVILENPSDAEVSDHPFDIISDFVDDFSATKRNLFSRVSGWVLSEKREDKIDDFVQEMDVNGFWPLDRRQAIAQVLLKNVDFKSQFHCDMKFHSVEDLAEHVQNCGFRSLTCTNESCIATFCASHAEQHDSICPFKIIPCEQKCSAFIMRREMDRHCITVCPMKLVNCPFYNLGCQSPVPYCLISQHCSESFDSHLVHILRSVHKEANEETLKHRQQQLEEASSLDHLRELQNLRLLTKKIKEMDSKLGPLVVICPVEDTEEAKDGASKETNDTKDGSKETNDTKDGSKETNDTKDGSKETNNTKGGSIATEETDSSKETEDTKDGSIATEERKDSSKETEDMKDGSKESNDTKDGSKETNDTKDGSSATEEMKDISKETEDMKDDTKEASNVKRETKDDSDSSDAEEEMKDATDVRDEMKDGSDSFDAEEEMKKDASDIKEEMKNASDIKEEMKDVSDAAEEMKDASDAMEEVKKERNDASTATDERKSTSNLVRNDSD